jgi:hypothetical protein
MARYKMTLVFDVHHDEDKDLVGWLVTNVLDGLHKVDAFNMPMDCIEIVSCEKLKS